MPPNESGHSSAFTCLCHACLSLSLSCPSHSINLGIPRAPRKATLKPRTTPTIRSLGNPTYPFCHQLPCSPTPESKCQMQAARPQPKTLPTFAWSPAWLPGPCTLLDNVCTCHCPAEAPSCTKCTCQSLVLRLGTTLLCLFGFVLYFFAGRAGLLELSMEDQQARPGSAFTNLPIKT